MIMTTIGAKKARFLNELRAHVQEDLDVITASQEEAQAGATHEENKAEGDKDMRSTEDSYLARGLAKRVKELREAVAMLNALHLRSFAEGDVVSLTAIVDVEDEQDRELCYFLAPVGGGVSLGEGGETASVVTPSSPLGRALLGREVGDEVELQTPQGNKFLSIVAIS